MMVITEVKFKVTIKFEILHRGDKRETLLSDLRLGKKINGVLNRKEKGHFQIPQLQ